jgi:hypothetical protein
MFGTTPVSINQFLKNWVVPNRPLASYIFVEQLVT